MTKLRDVLSDKSKWTQTAFARDRRGRVVPLSSPKACRFCIVGGLNKLDISEEEYSIKREKIVDYIKNLPDANRLYPFSTYGNGLKHYSLSVFNDFTSWETIDTMLNKLDI